MKFKVKYPSVNLANYIKWYWTMEEFENPDNSPQIVYPEGTSELIFHYGESFEAEFLGEGKIIQPKVSFCTQKSKTAFVSPRGNIGAFVVGFTPFGASAFFKLPYHEIINKNIELSDFMGDSVNWLHCAVANAATFEERIIIIEEFLIKRLVNDNLFEINTLERGIKALNVKENKFDVDVISDAACVSNRHLDRLFKKRIGLTPKQYIKIARFNKAIDIMKNKYDNNFTQIALDAGFYDQSHLTNNFIEFVGITPKKFITMLKEDNYQ